MGVECRVYVTKCHSNGLPRGRFRAGYWEHPPGMALALPQTADTLRGVTGKVIGCTYGRRNQNP